MEPSSRPPFQIYKFCVRPNDKTNNHFLAMYGTSEEDAMIRALSKGFDIIDDRLDKVIKDIWEEL